ncbi:MAG TPA: AAA family ATPase [Acidimicrobiales bacterium]|nr:AAA family ATPase [Acidimicrobiales bacterium]
MSVIDPTGRTSSPVSPLVGRDDAYVTPDNLGRTLWIAFRKGAQMRELYRHRLNDGTTTLVHTATPSLDTRGSVVPMSRILVTGMSGTGKSSALAELGRRGYRVVDTDDPGWREYREYVESSDEVRRGEWLWVEERITGLLDFDDGRSLFVQGCVRNQSKFYDRFNAVVLLSATADVILDRIARRTTNNYGKTPVERAMILDDLARVEPLLRASCTHELDASRPLDEVVANLIAIASRPMTT